ncbi:dolichol-phosphate mannosyltransferase [Sediminihabitans luteus]|uniref:Dolichol-phosphate mannosyltransferase n=1 Tax=Sediminihabitans luteus TaxID=1138585 RepID=A0A2M9CDC3_9CELL|nr:glycosyltransferase family 2 protein [Sediminihabitans luteus]PJJ69862.1 dolichol-phosphate mannosyltransferase [Sediminihabitans luteus]GII99182.1 dolichol monophosphate mannose synthase [Sediminihabitans luteus]
MRVTVIVPTFNEEPNVEALVQRVEKVCGAMVESGEVEILFVDDSTDTTPQTIERVAAESTIGVRMIHRENGEGGLSGAVVAGFQASDAEWCLVMDGDLQHPPEMIPVLLETGDESHADVVVASRYVGGGNADGLSGWVRHAVSKSSIVLARSMFPVRLRDCTDPMTGFFAVRRASIDMDALKPRGFKILLELLTRNKLKVVEEPFVFGERFAGESKANLAQGLNYLHQLASLRFGRMSRFAIIGAFGAVLNLAIMAGLMHLGESYVLAAIVSAVATITINFLLQERFVFHDLRAGRSVWHRFAESFGFNATEAAIRLPFLIWIVEATPVPPIVAQAVTIAVAFVLRFVFHSRVVYRAGRTRPVSPLLAEGAARLDHEVSPQGEPRVQ